MSETLFEFNERNYQDCQNSFRGSNNQEYYLGDYSIEAGSVIDVRAERKAVGSCSIIRLRAKTRLFFRRSWSHIRDDATDVVVLWFVKRGQLCVSHQSGYNVAKAGEFVITRSMTPFFIECQPDERLNHEVLHVIVPAHIFRGYIPQDLKTGFSIQAERRELQIAERMFMDVFEDEGALADETAQLLVDTALQVLSSAVKDKELVGSERQTVADKRLQEVLCFIEKHLSDSKLSTTFVAKACGISPRYLSFLLKLHGTPFSTLVWEQRLKMAARWIASSKPRDISISEIAYRAGFKSPAHFSRMFKRAYKVSPREYRGTQTNVAPEAGARALFAAGASLQ